VIPEQSPNGQAVLTVPEAIARRLTPRHFDPNRPLPDELLAKILRLATMAPSSYNLQPWRFVVVRSEANRERLKACASGQAARITEAPVVLIVLGYHYPHRTHLDMIVNQQVELGAITPETAQAIRKIVPRAVEHAGDPSLWATRSTMLAVATLLIAAEALGVASAMMLEGFDSQKLREAFAIPNDHTICGLIALGYATEVMPFPGRLGLEEVCFLEQFGGPWPVEAGSEAARAESPQWV
jgi:nitroreductase